MEVWRSLQGDLSNFAISSLGRVRNDYTGNILTNQLNSEGYKTVKLKKDGKQWNKRVNRLVAEVFVPNPDNLPQVDHINRDRCDNRPENLRWVNFQTQNSNRSPRPPGVGVKTILQLDYEGKIIREWSSATEASRSLGITRQNITQCCTDSKRVKSAGGYVWKHKQDDDLPGEQWALVHYSGRFHEVSSAGRVRNRYGVISYGSVESGYLSHNKIRVHRLVALAFLPSVGNWESLVVNHKDHNPMNNQVDNLEWMTIRENSVHGNGDSVARTSDDGQVTNFKCIKDAVLATAYPGDKDYWTYHNWIVTCCKSGKPDILGYNWIYL